MSSTPNASTTESATLLDLDEHDFRHLPAKLQWRLVAHYRAAGTFDHGERLLAVIGERNGDLLQLQDERARLAFAMGRHDEARSLLEERARRSPSATAQVALARFLMETGQLDAARRIGEELARANPDLLTVASLVADVARAEGRIETARDYYLGLLDAKPDNVGALLALVRLAADEADRESAVAFFRRASLVLGEAATVNQLTTAAELAARLDLGDQATVLAARAASQEEQRAATLASEVRAALADVAPRELTRAPRPTETRREEPPAPPRATSESTEGDDAPPEMAGFTVAWNAAEPDAASLDPRIVETLRRVFGHQALRPGQAAVIARVMARSDALAIMPTGAGKSLTFQLPALLLAAPTLVISPLIALMKDQVESLPPELRERTALINSTLSPDEMRDRLEQLRTGRLQLVYVAPERLRDHGFLRAMRAAGPALVVIDEAHCISMWGHDFRPDYLFIPRALAELGQPPVLAITATATPAMARQIGVGLGRPLDLVRISVFRPNLSYEVHRLDNRERKIAKVVEICRREAGAGIIYVGSRKDTEAIAGILRDNRVAAIPYHAGLPADIRAQNQDRFMSGQVRVVVATVAFGMGVDKANVRFIVHLSPPASLEAYAQESGRAGRDGRPARCVLLASPTDEAALKRYARRDEIDIESLRRVYRTIRQAAVGEWAILDRNALHFGGGDEEEEFDPRIAFGILDQAGLIARHPDAPATYSLRWQPTLRDDAGDRPDLSDPAWDRLAAMMGPDAVARGATQIATAAACAATGLSPVELDRLLGDRLDLIAREGMRGICLQLLPVRGDASATLTGLLDRARADADRRIRQVMAYVNGRRCRHAMLAAHLGEQLDPCGSSCDVCGGGAAARPDPARSSSPRLELGPAEALAVLGAVRSLPFPMGKTGLVKLLMGSVESRVRADRSPAFGALAGFKKGTIEGLIDRLIDDGLLVRDLNHEYKLIGLTRDGAAATLDDVAAYQPAASSKPIRESAAASLGGEDDAELGPNEAALFDRLVAWRREQAREEAVPPYVVAHNSMLRNLAVARPATPAALAAVPGFGRARVEKYGEALLDLIAGAGNLTVSS